jgi:hypothetical protein
MGMLFRKFSRMANSNSCSVMCWKFALRNMRFQSDRKRISLVANSSGGTTTASTLQRTLSKADMKI